jgi:hypothetical protein
MLLSRREYSGRPRFHHYGLKMTSTPNQTLRVLLGCLPRGVLCSILREALVVSKEPVIANLDIKKFDGYGVGRAEITVVNCVRTGS